MSSRNSWRSSRAGRAGHGDQGRRGRDGAVSVARSFGLRGAMNARAYLTGSAPGRVSAAQLSERMGNVTMFTRMSIKHKMAIVGAFQARGAVVAIIGDGGECLPFLFHFMVLMRVLGARPIGDDAPVLKMADVDVSMSKSGTDVAKGATDVILGDDNSAPSRRP